MGAEFIMGCLVGIGMAVASASLSQVARGPRRVEAGSSLEAAMAGQVPLFGGVQ